MKPYSVYLLEAGCPVEPPVFPKGVPSSLFPFWGHYCFYDFAAANLSGAPEGCVQVIGESRFRGLPEIVSGRSPAFCVQLLDDGPAGLQRLAAADPAEKVLIYPLSQVFLADPGALLQRLERPAAEVTRLSVDNTATDLYLVRRRTLLRLLKDSRPGKAEAAPDLGSHLNRLLAGNFEVIDDLPGLALFQNSLMQMYAGNLQLCVELGSSELESRFALLDRGHMPGGDIRIERGGTVKSSFLAAGTVVEGYVEGSVLFPGVSVRRGAMVYQSIVMSGNCIGTKAQVSRALILPHFGENGGGSPRSRQGAANIGEDAFIGLRSSSAVNLQYPTQLREGLTVLGAGVQVPRGFTIGPACLVGAEVSPQQLRGIKELRKGTTVLCNTRPSANS
jgi:hypothetical protein